MRLAAYFASSASLALLAAGGAAFGQTTNAPPAGPEVEQVVVTGTLLRGVAPGGSAVVRVGQDDIVRNGAAQVNQILASIPQMQTFNQVPRIVTGQQGITTYRPNLRNLPSLGNGNTLVLVDSHNIVGAAIQQNTPDIGALPPGAIERVEVVLDGGSATYGSNAVGGTLNFITRNRFEGVDLNVQGGIVGGYRSHSLGATGGLNWEGGGLVASLARRGNSLLKASERSLPRQDLRSFGYSDFRVRTCSLGNVIIGTQTYALPSRVPGTLNLCDASADGIIAPEENQTAGFVSLRQTLSDTVNVQIKSFASNRLTRTRAAALVDSGAVINTTNPFFQRIGTETQQTVAFSWFPVTGYSYSQVRLKQFDLAPQLTWKMPGEWQTTVLGDYGWSRASQIIPLINTTAEANALRGTGLTTATALNPYNLGASSPTVIAAITDWRQASFKVQGHQQIRAVADGPIFAIAGGEVRGAVGVNFEHVSERSQSVTGVAGSQTNLIHAKFSRDIKSVFGELVVPLVGDGNAMPFVQSLDVNLSGRYDKYQDVGSTSNPKIGVSWVVVEGLKLRGNWGTAFVAPSLQESGQGGIDATVQTNTSTTLRIGDPLTDRNRPTLRLTGGRPGLSPVDAVTWATGFDATPSFVPGLTVNLTYWSVKMEELITSGCSPPLADQLADPATFAGGCYIYRPTLAQSLAATQGFQIFTGNATNVESLYGAGNDPYLLVDARKINFGTFKQTGVDFRVDYRRRTDWGQFFGTVAGTRYLSRKQQTFPGGPFRDDLAANFVKLVVQTVAGFDYGPFTATATINYQDGFDLTNVAGQTKVGSFAPTNAFFRYSFSDDFSVSLNVDNVFDIEPDVVNQSGGVANLGPGQTQGTLGRYYQLTLRKHF